MWIQPDIVFCYDFEVNFAFLQCLFAIPVSLAGRNHKNRNDQFFKGIVLTVLVKSFTSYKTLIIHINIYKNLHDISFGNLT